MRIKTTAAVVAFAIAVAIAISVTGQEEPLPAVRAKSAAGEIPLAAPSIVLAVEPIREYVTPTLVDAARNNDYLTFDALYTAAKRRSEDVSQFATLHDLWTYSVTDPIGAFYGRDIYERLDRAYPGYAAYIADYRIVDDRGNAFYPTSETRAFLLDRIIEGRTPRVVIASRSPRESSRVTRSTPPAPQRKRAARSSLAPARTTAPAPSLARTAVAEKPATTAPAPVQTTAPAAAAAAPPVSTPAVAGPVTAAPQAVAPTPVAVPASPASTVPAAETRPERPLGGRGLLLLFIGLIGIGLLAVILRTPREEPMKIVQPPAASNVEPLRKPQAAPKPPAPDTPRATGSHG